VDFVVNQISRHQTVVVATGETTEQGYRILTVIRPADIIERSPCNVFDVIVSP